MEGKLVLQIECVDVIGPYGCAIVGVIIRTGVFVNDIVPAAQETISEIIDTAIGVVVAAITVKTVFALGLLDEQVEDIQFVTLVTTGNHVVAGDVFTGKFVVIGIVVKFIGLTRIIHTEVDGRAAAVVVGTHLYFTKTRLTDIQLAVIQFEVTTANFG